MDNFENIWLATGIVLLNATQLRLSGFPIGIGELMLALWIIQTLLKIFLNKYCLSSDISRIVVLFWFVSFSSLTLGLAIADSMNLRSDYWHHDYLSFIFSFIFGIALTNSRIFYTDLYKTINLIIILSIFFLSIILFLPFTVPFLETWQDDTRFLGWAKNPNQIALLLIMIPFLALFLLKISNSIYKKISLYLAIIFCIIIGIATQSDALIISWILGFIILSILGIYQRINKNINRSLLRTELKKILKLLTACGLILLIVILSIKFSEIIFNHAEQLYDKRDQGSDRFTLWSNAITAISHSPIFGLGPGPHSGINKPFLDFEAHNTFLDWGSSSGIVGLIAYFSILAWVAWQALAKRIFILFASVVALIIYCCFHYVLRQPIFWFYLLSIASLSQEFKPVYDNSMPVKRI